MSSTLFRPEALAAQQGTRFGPAVFYQPLSVKLAVLALLVLFVCFLVFAANADIKQTERVRGYLTSAGGEVKVYGGRPGVLTEILVSDGDFVETGAVLAVATAPQFDEQGQQAVGAVLQQINAQLRQLQRRIVVINARFELQDQQIRRQLTGMRGALTLLREQQQILQRRVALSNQDYQASRQLFLATTISEREHRQSASALYLLQQQAKAGALAIERHLQAMADAQQQLDLQPLQAQEERLMLDNTTSQLLARRHELQAQHRFTITATRDGIVNNFVMRIGDVIDPRQPVLTLLGVDDDLEAWLYLPTRALANVQQGVAVMISYDAYPYQTYGSFPAQIVSVADSVMDPREFLFPVNVGEPVYLVKARVADQSVTGGAGNSFRPGMQFSADIVTGERTVLQKLVSPLSGLGRRL